MARPKKQTVDYFPHDTDASDKRTLSIIQSKYGNDGYAFWYKMLQLLGRSPGHYYDYNNLANLEFLCAKTHQKDTETILNILATLASLDAIDAELHKQKVIWCQNFVDGVADAYHRTTSGLPQKPVNVGNNGKVSTETPENGTEIPQTKLKETKLKETKRSKGRPLKQKFGEFLNVFLTSGEYQKLSDKFGENNLNAKIENMSSAIESKGYKYKSHYAAILNWANKEVKSGTNGKCSSRKNPIKIIKG